MKRTHSESCQENDDDPPLKLSAEKPKSNVVEITDVNEITTESCEASIAQSSTSDDKPLLRTRSKEDVSENDIEEHKKESIDVDKLNEKKGIEMLWEAISSDDDIAMDTDEDGALVSDISENIDEFTDDVIINDFVPSLFEATPLRCIQNPSLSLFEYHYLNLRKSGDSKCEELTKVMKNLDYLTSDNIVMNEKWIVIAEQTVLIIPKILGHLLKSEYLDRLFNLVNSTLDLHHASVAHVAHTSKSTLIVRQLKVGLKLVEALCHYSAFLSNRLIAFHQIQHQLIRLFYFEHMSVSLKLFILRALDSTLNGSEHIRKFLCSKIHVNADYYNGYDSLLKILSVRQSRRVYFIVNRILRKIHFYELLQKLNTDENDLDTNSELLLQDYLLEIGTIYVKAPILMGCPKRFLQANTQFELTPALTHYDVYPTLYKLFDGSSFIKCIMTLLDKPNVNDSVQQNLLKLLQSLMDCDHGLRYLGCRPKVLNKLFKVLNKVNAHCQLKITLIYRIKVLTLVDCLSYFWECNLKDHFKSDQMESVDTLHDILLLTQSTIGKCAVVNVLTMGNNLDVILNFFKHMEKFKLKSDDLYMMYSLDLLKIVLENSEDVYYLKTYGALIYELACGHNCFSDLIAWTYPAMKHSTFFHDNVSELCNTVKNNIKNCLNLNKTLITSLRILKYLGIPKDQIEFQSVEDFVELKYKYIILQMYSCDMLDSLLTIVDKICDDYKQPSVYVWKLTGSKAKNVISIIRPSVILIKRMIILLIQSRENAYKDLSPIKILLRLYNLMHCVPKCSTIRDDAIKVIKDINKTLEAYVEINCGSSMVREVIVWTLSSPSVFVPGLLLLCELLPIPLPIKTVKPLEESAVTTVMSFRNAWTDNLTKVSGDLVELITVLSPCTKLLQLLKCLCVRIADLSMSMCLLVVQSLLDILISTENTSYQFTGCLNLLIQLCNNKEQATIKYAVLQTLNEGNPLENYENIVQKICENIKMNKQDNSILFVRCLCDCDIKLSSTNSEEKLSRDSVPNSYFYKHILNALLNCLFESHIQLSTLYSIIETFVVIIKNEFGLYQFRTVLDSFPKTFYNIFNSLLQKWNKEDILCANTLKITLQLINLCKNDNNVIKGLVMSTSQLREYLNWSSDVKDHPICLLKEIAQKDNALCYGHLIDLIEFLNNDQESIVELIEPKLAMTDLLTTLFKDRNLYILVNNIDKNYSSNIINMSTDTIKNLMEYNIEEMVSDLPNFNIKDEINGLFKFEHCVAKPEPIVQKQQTPVTTVRKEKENITNTSIITSTPIRHKVFSRLGTIQRPDTFRNRLPNTSRPPSLHVDDFVAMETRIARPLPRYNLPTTNQNIYNMNNRERITKVETYQQRTYDLYPYKSHLSLHSWHTQINTLAHLRADYHHNINNRQLELQRRSLLAEWRQLRVEATIRKSRAYSRR